ncbi:MAG: flagella basal body P-ring formation protein FlgA [Candidatus Melainabacteria bacterium]|nr:MAG: flagella basal body P-ring formation protein FlgA [Candidatus Melainabacteria bacterium]
MDDFNLEDVRIASPCKASWRKMKGDDRVRNCAKCSLNVYNISEMSREEAAELIANTEGRLCIRLWRRRDGTVITKDCPMAFKQIRYGIAAFSSIFITAILATMQWTGWFTRQEMELMEKKRDLQAGMRAKGKVIRVARNLQAGHRIRSQDLQEVEVEQSRIPVDAMWSQDMAIGMNLRKDVAHDSILTNSDIAPVPNVVFSGERLGVDLDLTPEDVAQVDEIAIKKKTSVAKLMREWIMQRVKRYERN